MPLEFKFRSNKGQFLFRLKKFAFDSDLSHITPDFLTKSNCLRRWRRRYTAHKDLRISIEKLVLSVTRAQKTLEFKRKLESMLEIKISYQTWRKKAILIKRVIERLDFRRVKSFKCLQNFTKLTKHFFTVLSNTVHRK